MYDAEKQLTQEAEKIDIVVRISFEMPRTERRNYVQYCAKAGGE